MHALVEATKQAFIVRDREVADPAQMVRRPEHWLSELELKLMAAQVSEQAQPWPHTAEPGDTVWIQANPMHYLAFSAARELRNSTSPVARSPGYFPRI